ncbi:MAG: tRNA modification GTPase MnmE [Candidatus Hepatoplasma vulgare]|nr:MAG: tRNA modification GTPase MnmE [Candidatus Hepatoplasma sp.]
MDTIFSLVTKPINQNVGIIRISGPETFLLTKKIFPFTKLNHSTLEVHKLFLNDEFIDDVILLIFASPKSFTGEDTIEIQFHGSMYIADKILSFLEKQDVRQAKAGEFMQQAFFNNKIDLIQSEAINELITTEDKLVAKKASENINNKQSNELKDILIHLEDIIALIQVSIDYPENTDLPKYSHEGIGKKVKKLKENIEKILTNSNKLLNASKGVKIAFIGFPNVGKSTLLNSFLKKERAITSNIAGTTRDLIESIFFLDGLKITLIDTAGIRKTNSILEKKSIEKAILATKEADLIFMLLDSTKDIKKQEEELFKNIDTNDLKIVKVLTKIDKNQSKRSEKDYLKISALNNEISEIIDYIKLFIKNEVINFEEEEKAILITSFQFANLQEILDSLIKIESFIFEKVEFDLISYEIERAMDIIKKILGIKKDPNYLNDLFSRFCIGK